MELKNYDLAVTTTVGSIAQAPNGYHLSFVGGFLVETTGGAETVTLGIYDSTGTLKTEIPFTLTANEKVDISTKIFLNQLETLKATCTTGTATIVLFGAETVKDSDNVPDNWSYLGDWISTTAYVLNNLVVNDGSAYICTTAHTNSEPPSANWSIFAGGIDHTTRTTGTGAAGATDTYTLYRDSGSTDIVSTFTVYNGADGADGDLTDIVQDTTPELGGDLDGKGKKQYNTILKEHTLGSTAATITCDCAAYNQFSFEPTAALTVNFTNMVAGGVVSIEMTGGGDHTITWQVGGATTNFKWADGTEPDWSTTTGVDIATFVGDGSNSLSGVLFAKGVA